MQNNVRSTNMLPLEKQNTFATCHPIVNLFYFLLVTLSTVLTMHPMYLLISLLGAFCYACVIYGRKAVRLTLLGVLPLMLFAAAMNPLFHHGGVTVLWYFPSGNPLTLESILYGCATGAMMAAMVLWFYCYTAVMTSDKFVYLFGRIVPALSLILSMTLRFVPMFYQQFQQIREAQKGMGYDSNNATLYQRIRHTVTLFSILLTWALEHAIETADSMKCRGYGLPGRTAFSLYRFEKRDIYLLLWLLCCTFGLLAVAVTGAAVWQYYPLLRGSGTTPMAYCGYLFYLALCLTPTYLNKKEEYRWHHRIQSYKSTI